MCDCCKSKVNIIAKPETEEDIAASLLRRVSTDKLVSELIKRNGVERLTVPVNDAYNIDIAHIGDKTYDTENGFGPATILIITD